MKLEFLALPEEERRLYIDQAAVRRSLSPVILEKDFWANLEQRINQPGGK